jgi:beta-lactamase class A
MSKRMSRRSVLVGMAGAAALGGCSAREPQRAGQARAIDLSDLEERHGGRLGVSARDASSGREAAWRGDERFAYCSTFKAFLAAATMERVQAGAERLDRAVSITARDIVPHAPVTGAAVGSTLTIEQLCRSTVMVSDNPAANILIRELGGLDAWRAWYRSVGDRLTRVDRLETELNSAEPGDPRDTTTVRQYVANLQALFAGSRLSKAHRDLLLRWMVETPTGAARLPAAAPRGSRVAHKTGTGANGSTSDIGMLWLPDGRAIYVAAFFTGAPDVPLAAREAVLADGARRALARLGTPNSG